MAKLAAPKVGVRSRLITGPPSGVVYSRDPFDDDPSTLQNARNMYIPVPDGGSGAYARPGFTLDIGGNPIYTSAGDFRAQGGYTHVDLDGAAYNFAVEGGHLFRIDNTLATATDVTPVGVTIDGGVTQRVKFVSLAGQMVVSDGVHAPWVASDLSSTPITGTYIDFDGAGVDWSAQDVTAYSGAIVFLLKALDGDPVSMTIAWSAPGDPTKGYQQPTFDYAWTLEQTGSNPIYAIFGTNIGLFYWRQQSIGLATGALGPDFQTTHTDDAVSENVGSRSPQCIVGFHDRVFFIDQIGRPYMLPFGGTPQPIWQQMREEVYQADTSYQSVTQRVSTATFEANLNLYLVAIWSQAPSIAAPCRDWYAFDAETGRYMGKWFITTADGGSTDVEVLCTFGDDVGRTVLAALGTKDAHPGANGYLWSMNALLGTADILATEGGDTLTEEDTDLWLATEGQQEVWKDNGVVPWRSITTQRLGYASDTILNVDQVTIITGDNAPCMVEVQTTTVAAAVEGTPSPNPSSDGTYRLVCGTNVMGREVTVTVSPTTADDQWSWQQLNAVVIPSNTGPQDP